MDYQHSEQYKTGPDGEKYNVYTFEGQLRLQILYFQSKVPQLELIFPQQGKWSLKDYEAFSFYLDKRYIYQSIDESGFLWNDQYLRLTDMQSLCDVELTINNQTRI